MKSKRAVVVWKIVFAVILTATFALWCVLMVGEARHSQTDDIFGSFMTVELGLGALVLALTEELVIYQGVRYFLWEKDTRTNAKTAGYIILLGIDFLIILLEAIYIFSYIGSI